MAGLKKILPVLLFALLLSPHAALSDGGGPNNYGYVWNDGIDYDWIDTSAGTVLPLALDDFVGNIPFGFTFDFYSYDKTEFAVTSNGLVGLGNANNITEYTNQCPFLPTNPNNLVAVYWDDLNPPGGGTVRYFGSGTAPYRYMVIEWNQVPHNGGSSAITAQAVFLESANWIFLNYQSASAEEGSGASIGLKSSIGWDNLLVGCNTQGIVADEYTIWFGMEGPVDFTAKAESGAIALSWLDENHGHEGTSIERAEEETGPFETIGEAAVGLFEYVDADAGECSEYWYRARLWADRFYGPYTDPAGATFPPYGPTDFTVIAVSSLRNELYWKDRSDCETGYVVERKKAAKGPWFALATLDAESESHVDDALEAGQTYLYRVKAVTATLDSSYTDESGVTVTLEAPEEPAAAAYSWEEIDLSWNDASEGESGFSVERKGPGENDFIEVANVGADAESYRDFGLEPKSAYTYRLRSFALQAYSEYSEEFSATTPAEGQYAQDDDDDSDDDSPDDDDDNSADDDTSDDDNNDDDNNDDNEGCCG